MDHSLSNVADTDDAYFAFDITEAEVSNQEKITQEETNIPNISEGGYVGITSQHIAGE